MGKYLKEFELTSQYEEYINSTMGLLPNVSLTNDDNVVHYNPIIDDSDIDYSQQYLTFEAIEDSTFNLTENYCEYSLDEGNTWVSLPWRTNTPTVPAGSKIMFKASPISMATNYGIGTFSSTGKFNVSGNIMSMLYGDNFIDKTDLTGKNYAFRNLFSYCTNVVEAHNLILPATTLANYCYCDMFQNCTSLTTAPELPATTLAEYCYYRMFVSCRSLTTAPELPATTLAKSCYSVMFEDCTSFTTTPELPATTLVNRCYVGMFRNCTSLSTAPELPATTLADNCYQFMFSKCTSLSTAPELPATTLANNCYYEMFRNCTSLSTAPELPATTLANNCYQYMFQGCSKLNNIVMLATDISASNCLKDWANGVGSTGTFTKAASMTSLPTGASGIPSGWEVIDYAS